MRKYAVILLPLIAFGLSIGSLEIAVRIYDRWDKAKILNPVRRKPDPEIGWVGNPNMKGRSYFRGQFDVTEETNSTGMRGDREYGAKSHNTVRIIVLGDSFIFGVGTSLEDTFCLQLENLLNGMNPGQTHEVLNAGVYAYDSWQQGKLLERFAPIFDPDIVIQGIFIGNDLGQNSMRDPGNVKIAEKRESEIYEPDRFGAKVPIPFKELLSRNSAAYRFLRDRYHALLQLMAVRAKPSAGKAWWLDQYRKDLSVNSVAGYAITDSLLSDVVAWSIENETQLVHLLIPEQGQIIPGHWTRSLGDNWAFDPASYDLTKPNRWLLGFAERKGIPSIDLQEVFRRERNVESLYFGPENHWSGRAQAIAAREVAGHLERNGLLDQHQEPLPE